MKQLITFLIFFMLSVSAGAQHTADDGFARPLADVLSDIEQQFGIQIKYDKAMIEGKMLVGADWRIRPWSAEESLNAVLAPFDYKFVMDNGKYKIKAFEYPRTTPDDGRKFLDYLCTLYADKESWEQRRAELLPCFVEKLRFSQLPPRPDSKVILTARRKFDGYTVENFAIETLPGVYVAGSIYRPAKIGKNEKCPVMLNPNGHFADGRYRPDQQIRCAMQARLGMIAASWDIFAWGESALQFNPAMHRLSIAQTIQTWNALQILDYLLTLPDADPARVGITGGSGGASLAMLVAAIDPRISLSIPVVMLSSHFSGGCPCESGMGTHLCGHRTNNAELAALFAPKPQLVISDGKDWSFTVPELEFPFIQRTYGFYQAENNIENVHFENEGHDYGPSKRLAMYKFVAERFNLDLNRITNKLGEIDESPITIEKEEDMRAFGRNGENFPQNAINEIPLEWPDRVDRP